MTEITIEKVNIDKIIMNPSNPRTIKDEKFKKLVKSIKEFPQMLDVRPIVVDDDMVVLGGNMRTKACISAGLTEVSIIKFKNLSADQKKEFIVKDNVGYGEWDYELLYEDYEKEKLLDWGLDVYDFKTGDNVDDETYTRKIEAPIYEPRGDQPLLTEVFDRYKYDQLINEIDSIEMDDDIKTFLKLGATRHIVFNFEKIADYYANSPKEIQELMEKQAMVLIDFNKAIENGFVRMSKDITNIFIDDYED